MVPRGGITNVGDEGLTDAGIRQRGRRGLIGARRPAVDSVEYGVTESGEVVGNCEWAAGVPNQNAVGLPATKLQLLGSASVFCVLRLIRVHESIPAFVSRRQRNSS
jgi:hypothetical protein